MQNPRMTTEALEALYSDEAYHDAAVEYPAEMLSFALRRPTPLMHYLADFLPQADGRHNGSRPSMLDVGSGIGGAMLAYRMEGWQTYGVEPNPKLAELAREFGLEVRDAFFDEETFDDLKVDLIFTCHAYEHFLDPLAISKAARTYLKDDGFLFVCVPTFRKARAWARKWMNFSHTFMFTHKTLGNLLHRAGFEAVDHRYNSSEGELWLLARPSEQVDPMGPLPYQEDWQSVKRELAMEVPLRAMAWTLPEVGARNAQYLPELLLDPREFVSGLRRRVKRVAQRQ